MALLFGLALVVPFLRDFYELSTPTGEAIVAWAVGVALGVGGMLGALRLLGVLAPLAGFLNETTCSSAHPCPSPRTRPRRPAARPLARA
jgi:hypothetical protein